VKINIKILQVITAMKMFTVVQWVMVQFHLVVGYNLLGCDTTQSRTWELTHGGSGSYENPQS
jgi:hypothetical protein